MREISSLILRTVLKETYMLKGNEVKQPLKSEVNSNDRPSAESDYRLCRNDRCRGNIIHCGIYETGLMDLHIIREVNILDCRG